MKICKLTPILKDHASWKYSTHFGELIVRANDESDARKIADQTFTVGAPVRPGESTSSIPWYLREVVSCESIEDSRFSVHGRREILFPPELDAEFPDSPSFKDG